MTWQRTARRTAAAAGAALIVLAGGSTARGDAATPGWAWDSPPTAATMQATTEDGLLRCAIVSVTDAAGHQASGGYLELTMAPSNSSSYGMVFHGGFKSCVSGSGHLPTAQTVSGYVDVDGDGVQDAGEPTFSGAV